jgi:hypothetical protein
VEKDKGLMSAVNWARVHRSNFPADGTNSEEEDDPNAVKVFARDEHGNWSVPDHKVGSYLSLFSCKLFLSAWSNV